MARKIPNEQQSRAGLLAKARALHCEGEVKSILEKYDRALKNCTNETERRHIAHTGIAELHNFFYCRGNLVVDGVELIPAEPGYEETTGKIRKL